MLKSLESPRRKQINMGHGVRCCTNKTPKRVWTITKGIERRFKGWYPVQESSDLEPSSVLLVLAVRLLRIGVCLLLPQTQSRTAGGRRGAVVGPLCGAPTHGAAFGLPGDTDNGAASTAAAASAVKFMLIESEAAATSASFLPAQFSSVSLSLPCSFFFPSSDQVSQPPQRLTSAALFRAGTKKQESQTEIEPKEKGGHNRIL